MERRRNFSTAFFDASYWSVEAIWISAPQSRAGLGGSNWMAPVNVSHSTVAKQFNGTWEDGVVNLELKAYSGRDQMSSPS